MAEHHSLGTPRTAGRVEDGRQVPVDGGVRLRFGRFTGTQLVEIVSRNTVDGRTVVADDHDEFERRAVANDVVQTGQPPPVGDQAAHVAVADDMGNLLGEEVLVDGYERPRGLRDAEDRGDQRQAGPQVDTHAVGPADTRPAQPGRQTGNAAGKLGVRQPPVAVDQGLFVR